MRFIFSARFEGRLLSHTQLINENLTYHGLMFVSCCLVLCTNVTFNCSLPLVFVLRPFVLLRGVLLSFLFLSSSSQEDRKSSIAMILFDTTMRTHDEYSIVISPLFPIAIIIIIIIY